MQVTQIQSSLRSRMNAQNISYQVYLHTKTSVTIVCTINSGGASLSKAYAIINNDDNNTFDVYVEGNIIESNSLQSAIAIIYKSIRMVKSKYNRITA